MLVQEQPGLAGYRAPPGPQIEAPAQRSTNGLAEIRFLPEETTGLLPTRLGAVGTGPVGLLYRQTCLAWREVTAGQDPLPFAQ